MPRIKILAAFLTAGFINAHSQAPALNSTLYFAEELRKLVVLNSIHEGVHDLSGPEAVNLSRANPAQLMEITASYHQSEILNAKGVCYYYLSRAVLKKETSQELKQELVEIMCRYYLSTDLEIQSNDNVLLMLNEKDFTANAKKYIAALIDSIPKFSYDVCARLSAVAQVKKNIPALWEIANKNIDRMHSADIDVLASLARLGEKQAGQLLCQYYNSIRTKTDSTSISDRLRYAEQFAFSLDKTVLECMIADFKTIDPDYSIRGSDYFFSPSRHLGKWITTMLKNYPYPKEYNLDPHQLAGWLSSVSNYELKEK